MSERDTQTPPEHRGETDGGGRGGESRVFREDGNDLAKAGGGHRGVSEEGVFELVLYNGGDRNREGRPGAAGRENNLCKRFRRSEKVWVQSGAGQW